ncbi:AraC family transcriptional regulator [Chitinophaga filiformis]|uniref:helix-turn-helix domain-containing protein n=1 Tax=Chitinophaga filiformis TaxID=104663 RepID=UPI001F44B9F1|nr:AraC family transcriptional regulator [Chitinophaga filiformis]MCF6402852.1 AraC family transcriptional regulator [Chitinophaga filiformis]MCF6403230.1 AraC family transcriptional regulator [Chitinophaga filiformis]
MITAVSTPAGNSAILKAITKEEAAQIKIPKKYISRKEEIYQDFLRLLDEHLADIVAERTDKMKELRDFAEALFIHPTHLSNVIKEHTGYHPCFFYEGKLLKLAKELLLNNKRSVADVAYLLTYDPSNFTKWFKSFEGVTPSQFRRLHQQG